MQASPNRDRRRLSQRWDLDVASPTRGSSTSNVASTDLPEHGRLNLQQLFYLITLTAAAISLFGWWGLLVAGLIALIWRQILDGTLRELERVPTEEMPSPSKRRNGNPHSSQGISNVRSVKRQGISRVEVVVVLLLIGLLIGLVLPPQPDSDPLLQGAASLRQVASALEEYRDDFGRYPPAIVCDREGRPLHSWRAMLLPYLEEPALAEAYHFDEPWNSPNNSELGRFQPWHLRDFSHDPSSQDDTTNVQLIEVDGQPVLIESDGHRCNWLQPNELSADVLQIYSSLPQCDEGFWDHGFFRSTFRGRLLATPHCELIVQPAGAGQIREFLEDSQRRYETVDHPVALGRSITVIHFQQAFRFIAFVAVALFPLLTLDRLRRLA